MADNESGKPVDESSRDHEGDRVGEGAYVDDFVERFMRGNDLDHAEDDASDVEPEVKRAGASAPLEKQILEEQIIMAMREIYDPELPVNIYDLGLIYKVDIDDDANVAVDMTLTSPGCPVAQTFPGTVENAVMKVEGVNSACVELVWDPPWTKDRMSEATQLELGFF